jgi:hypothetical protein
MVKYKIDYHEKHEGHEGVFVSYSGTAILICHAVGIFAVVGTAVSSNCIDPFGMT